MAPTVIIVADSPWGAALAPGLEPFAASFLADTLAVVRTLRGAQVSVRYTPAFPPEALPGVSLADQVAPIDGAGAGELAQAFTDALRSGDPALLISANLPHLPPWRLRDAATHLDRGADVVIGPTDQGDWYLLGLRSPEPDLLRLIPAMGEPAEGLALAASSFSRRLSLLPGWFTIRSAVGLPALAEVLRTMPPGVAERTRALFEVGYGTARAVGG